MDTSSLPTHMINGLELYFYDGILPGSFLTAVLENNLVYSFARADMINKAAMENWACFLHWEMPSGSWGSPEKVAAWCEARQVSPIPH